MPTGGSAGTSAADDELVTSSTNIPMNSVGTVAAVDQLDFGLHAGNTTNATSGSPADIGAPDSPSSFLKSLYDSDLFVGDAGNGHRQPPLNGNAALYGGGGADPSMPIQIKLEPAACKIEPPTQLLTNPFSPSYVAQNSHPNGARPTPPPQQQQPPPPYASGLHMPPPGYPMNHQGLLRPQTFQPSPGLPLPDSTSFLQYAPKPNGFDHRRMSEGDGFSDGVFFEQQPSPMGHVMRSQSINSEYPPFIGSSYMNGDGGGALNKTNGHSPFAVVVGGADSSASQQSSAVANGGSGSTTPVGNTTSNPVGSQKAFVPCKVCGDKASGYHYGVTSCEGCKGFFRRSIQKQIEYRCLRDGKCMVFRLNRNRCQYCRFKKCLAVGMSRDSVRYGRVPKRPRGQLNAGGAGSSVGGEGGEEARVSSMTSDDAEVDGELEKRQLALYDVILSVSQAHHSNCAYTDDKVKNLAQRPMHFPIIEDPASSNGVMSTETMERQRIAMWETLADFTTPAIQRVVEFAKRIPGFTDLVQEDQLALIKCAFFEIWLLRLSRMFNPQQLTLTHHDGSVVTRDHLSIIYSPELVSCMFRFAVAFNELHLNDGEIGLFSGIVLLCHDRPRLKDPSQVEKLQDKLMEALKLQLSRSHSSDPHSYPNLIGKLAELRQIGHKHNEVLQWYRQSWQRLKLPPLFAEIYDINKLEETAANDGQTSTDMKQPIVVAQPPPPMPPLHHIPPYGNGNGCYEGN